MFDPVLTLLNKIGAPLLAGAILDAPDGRFTNTNLLIEPDGQIEQRYDKVHLVPFGEYVPWHFFRSIVPALDRELPSDAIAGKHLVVFKVDGGVGTLICFESTYPELARSLVRDGARILIVTTNNASFGTSPAAREHLAMSQMQAVSEGRAVVHAAISGISAVIQPDGKITQEVGLFRPALLRARLPMASGLTPYARYGSAIETGIGTGALLFTLLPFAIHMARKKGES
jgi:apolipoprotein N-acyltransferase